TSFARMPPRSANNCRIAPSRNTSPKSLIPPPRMHASGFTGRSNKFFPRAARCGAGHFGGEAAHRPADPADGPSRVETSGTFFMFRGNSATPWRSFPTDRSPPHPREITMIETQRLSKTYGRMRAVDEVSFRVEPGQVLG